MPVYTFKNKETGEVRDLTLTSEECEAIMADKDAPIQRVFRPASFSSQAKSDLRMAGSEWNNLLTKIKKGSDNQSTINV